MTVLGPLACAALGLWVGLYLNLVIDRLPQKQSLWPLRAGCCRCGDASAEETSPPPVVPWALRGRRCPACGEVVPWRYPAVEVVTGGLFGGVALRFGADAALPAYLVLMAALVAVSAIDLEHQIIPNRIVYPTIALSLPLLALAASADGDLGRLGRALAGAGLAFALLLAVHIVSPKGMGFGDVRLAFVLGLFLGWISLGTLAVGLFLGFALGALSGLVLVAVRLRTSKDSVPFGPFLAAGAAIAVFAGQPLIDWWLRT